MGLDKVDNIDYEPVIGKRYLVPCLFTPSSSLEWTPVYGPEHDDERFFNFKEIHLHYDIRFISFYDLTNLVSNSIGDAAFHMKSKTLSERLTANVIIGELNLPLKHRELVCRRKVPVSILHKNSPPGFRKMEEHYADHKIDNCKTCPHRGFRLAGLPKDKEGNVVCPGHGLKWNMENGKLVKRNV